MLAARARQAPSSIPCLGRSRRDDFENTRRVAYARGHIAPCIRWPWLPERPTATIEDQWRTTTQDSPLAPLNTYHNSLIILQRSSAGTVLLHKNGHAVAGSRG
jgi:hypothetical protein